MGLADERDPAAAERRPLRILGYAVDAGRLVFFRYDDPKMIPFPCPISVDRAADIASDWLLGADYGEDPDHDGSNEKGWRCFRDAWGRIDGMGHGAFVAVEPGLDPVREVIARPAQEAVSSPFSGQQGQAEGAETRFFARISGALS